MPYTIPTIADFRARFPEFATTADPAITAAILNASDFVDQSWSENDYQPAILYLAAHLVVLQRDAAQAASDTGGVNVGDDTVYVSSVSMEGRSISYSQRSGSAASTRKSTTVITGATEFLRQTFYGRMYEKLMRRNIIAVEVVGGYLMGT